MIPKTLPIIIELEKVFMINLAAAAGVSSILKTKIIPIPICMHGYVFET